MVFCYVLFLVIIIIIVVIIIIIIKITVINTLQIVCVTISSIKIIIWIETGGHDDALGGTKLQATVTEQHLYRTNALLVRPQTSIRVDGGGTQRSDA